MASKMAVSKVPKTYLTKKLDIKHFNFDLIIQGNNYEAFTDLIHKVEILKMVSKMAAI